MNVDALIVRHSKIVPKGMALRQTKKEKHPTLHFFGVKLGVNLINHL